MATLPDGLVNLREYVPSIVPALRYATPHNFLGRPVKGYHGTSVILTRVAADALAAVAKDVSQDHFQLVIYDAYRPQKAVHDFCAWEEDAHDDLEIKSLYYPNLSKSDLFKNGYISAHSTHSRGSTVDLTLIKMDRVADFTGAPKTKKSIHISDGRTLTVLDDGTQDMGVHFDLFDLAAHPGSKLVDESAQKNRLYLANVMKKHGFLPISTEWWHFIFEKEPFPDTYFDFNIE